MIKKRIQASLERMAFVNEKPSQEVLEEKVAFCRSLLALQTGFAAGAILPHEGAGRGRPNRLTICCCRTLLKGAVHSRGDGETPPGTHPSPKPPKMIAGLAARPSRCVFTVSTCGIVKANEGQQGSRAASQEPTHRHCRRMCTSA